MQVDFSLRVLWFQFDTIAKDGREFYETIAMPVNAFPKKILIALK
jgi:hypothetical protein